jgi:cell division protein FtsB
MHFQLNCKDFVSEVCPYADMPISLFGKRIWIKILKEFTKSDVYSSRMKQVRLHLIIFILLSLIAFWISYIIIYGNGGIVNRANIAMELRALEHEIQELEKEKEMLEWEMKNLNENRRYIESVARELGFKKKDEIIFKFIKKNEVP